MKYESEYKTYLIRPVETDRFVKFCLHVCKFVNSGWSVLYGEVSPLSYRTRGGGDLSPLWGKCTPGNVTVTRTENSCLRLNNQSEVISGIKRK